MARRRDWLLKKVRRKNGDPSWIGTVIESAKYFTWWVIEWPDGKRTQDPERNLEIVEEAPK